MTQRSKISRTLMGTGLAAIMAASFAATASAPAAAQANETRPVDDVAISVGAGKLIRLPGNMTDLFVANPGIADVQVRSANQLYIFGKAAGSTTLYATNSAGRVVYSANVQVGTNLDSIDDMLRVAMPQAQIEVTPMNGFVLLTGTVADPADIEDASRLVEAFVGGGTQVMSRLKTATPMQVMLQVRIAEVNRTMLKNVGVNILTQDNTSGFNFGIGQGGGIDPETGAVTIGEIGTTLQARGNLFGLDIISALDLAETNGLSTTLAEPTLVALSGETASFLAGGEFPVPAAQGLSGTTIEFKPFGVSLAFTPTVLEGGRISMRVRPEVSEVSSANSVTLNGFEVPSLTTRRTETTVELGSGQSFVIGGLMSNTGNNSVDKAPFLGSLPIIGALFRSNNFRRNQTELVIVVTPYLVKPVDASRIALPTDGFRIAGDAQRLLLDQQDNSRSGERRPMPTMASPQAVAPGISVPPAAAVQPQPSPASQDAPKPGFGF